MAKRKTLLFVAASAIALSACSDSSPLSSWTQPAGDFLDEGGFGNPTMNNMMVHTGQANLLVDLNNRFSSEVNPMVNFAFDRATLDAEAKSILDEQAKWIAQFPEVRFRVYGHTDLVGSDAYNKGLGQRRANAVVAYLVGKGIDRGRLEAVASFGETQPLVVTENRERRNRRTVTEVTGFVQNASGPLHGKYANIIFRQYISSATANTQTADATLAEISTGG